MRNAIISIDQALEKVVSKILAEQQTTEWITRTHDLHARYMQRDKKDLSNYIRDSLDALAYLALRLPATYAQITGALAAVQEVIPSWQPRTMLDIGSGPGTSCWAAHTIFPTLEKTTCIDQDTDFIKLGKAILTKAPISHIVTWKQRDITIDIDTHEKNYDLVVIANVLNELSDTQRRTLLTQAFQLCTGIFLIVEPGTPIGSAIVQEAAKQLSDTGIVLAPYIDNTFVASSEYWLHFPQRFKRPEFTRRIRQHMRESTLTASDWENAKYSYVAIGRIPPENRSWGRCVGPLKIHNGYLEIPILTKDQLMQQKVMKRDKKRYDFAKKLQWGELIEKDLNTIS